MERTILGERAGDRELHHPRASRLYGEAQWSRVSHPDREPHLP